MTRTSTGRKNGRAKFGDGGEDTGLLLTSIARKAFAENGYHGVSIRDIAKMANLSLAALYYYHPSKQHLLYALLKQSTVDFTNGFHAALRAADNQPVAKLDALIRSTIEYRVHHRVESDLIATEMRNLDPESLDELLKPWDEARDVLEEIIVDGVEAGVFTIPDPNDARHSVLAICNSIAGWYDPNTSVSLDELVTRYQFLCHELLGYSPKS
ncbi:TetR/AcrR family transcriptional regulator [Nocardia sp. NPDC059239]|uniref:TetR/AcrR family transcriptional regulator n=1 Tax=unclassified Nocardia TaxID=2637762 RepID=UPI0036B5EC02